MRPRVPAMLVLAVFVIAACTSPGGSPSASPEASSAAPGEFASAAAWASPSAEAEPVELTIFLAASLTGALEEVKTAYEADNPGTTLTLVPDSSSALRTQIEQGAPADVFLSADTTNPMTLVDAGLAEGDAVNFAGNELTVIVPTDNPAGIETPADLAGEGVIIITAGEEVPITKYAVEAIDNLAALPDYPADFAAAYAANIATREDNVRAVVTKIELGEGDAGIVYVTDAEASDLVEAIEIPEDANVPATYAGVVVAASKSIEAATAFLEWFAGPDGKEILAGFGFRPPTQ